MYCTFMRLLTVLWRCCLGDRKSIRPAKNVMWCVIEVLAWLSVCSEVQMTCIWSSWCYWYPLVSVSVKSKMVYPSGTDLPRKFGKKVVKWLCTHACVRVCMRACTVYAFAVSDAILLYMLYYILFACCIQMMSHSWTMLLCFVLWWLFVRIVKFTVWNAAVISSLFCLSSKWCMFWHILLGRIAML